MLLERARECPVFIVLALCGHFGTRLILLVFRHRYVLQKLTLTFTYMYRTLSITAER